MKTMIFKDGVMVQEIDAPDPAPTAPKPLSFVQFVGLAMVAGDMTDEAYDEAKSNPKLTVFFDLLMNADGIHRDDPLTARGGAKFVSEGMLSQEGWDAMQANWPRQ